MSVAVVDLFCGVGGLTCGLQQAGLNVVAGLDSDETCRYAYTTNNHSHFVCADISTISSRCIDKLYNRSTIKVLVGCAPCQTFSKQTNKYKNRINDKKWNLLRFFSQHVKNICPHIVSMENVPELIKYNVFRDFVSELKELNYHVYYKIINCSEYGLPQKRRRLVFLASRMGEISLSPPPHLLKERTVRDVISNLPPLKHGQTDENDPLHRCSKLSEINIKRIRQSIPGGTWRDWDNALLLECHKKITGKTYSSVYGRMRWDEPSPTMTTQFFSLGTGRFGHPEQDRALSLREGALLQTFPLNYKFYEDPTRITIRTIARHIGNAVPVELGKIIGDSIISHLSFYYHGSKK